MNPKTKGKRPCGCSTRPERQDITFWSEKLTSEALWLFKIHAERAGPHPGCSEAQDQPLPPSEGGEGDISARVVGTTIAVIADVANFNLNNRRGTGDAGSGDLQDYNAICKSRTLPSRILHLFYGSLSIRPFENFRLEFGDEWDKVRSTYPLSRVLQNEKS